ncbi:MAG TPA: DUF488 domain-containing protein [Ktedonobacteraceae bacterium]|nr:DUF488 domain-containing protein [Ktedonobacteraceae bacterium]
MPATPVYTIGYGNRSIEDFITLLQKYGIKYLVDLRSQPYSRYKPEFSKAALEQYLTRQQIRYVYMGDTLGGRPEDTGCYTDDGKVDYTILREKDFYQRGISRLRTAWEKQYAIALMCSELKPQECHRGKLIGNTLDEQGMNVMHIDEAGNPKTQDEVNQFFAIGQASGQLSFLETDAQVALNQKTARSGKKYVPTKESA